MDLYQLFKKISKLFRLSWHERLLLLEAFILTGIFRFAILFIGFSKIARISGKYKEESTEQVSAIEKAKIRKIGWAVLIVSTHTPWESKCLVKALTAQIMLARRKINSTLYLGVAKDEEKKLIAHAWLRSGMDIVTGDDVRLMFTVVAKFANCVRRIN